MMIRERWSIYHLLQQVRRRPEPGRGHRLAAQKVWPLDVSTPVNVKRAPRYKLMVLDDGGQIHTKAFSYLKVASGCPPPSILPSLLLPFLTTKRERCLAGGTLLCCSVRPPERRRRLSPVFAIPSLFLSPTASQSPPPPATLARLPARGVFYEAGSAAASGDGGWSYV